MKDFWHKIASVVIVFIFWILIWEIASLLVGQKVLLPSPIDVCKTLALLCTKASFWLPILNSSLRIFLGFLGALFIGTILAIVSYKFKPVELVLRPFMTMVKAVPVASFIILALIWINSDNLSLFIALLMALPQIYCNILTGLIASNKELIEMAKIYHVSFGSILKGIVFPALFPYLKTCCSVALGLCYKAGIAAEVIGLPKGTVGENIYNAKIYLMTPELFAWTIAIVLVSVAIDKLFMFLLGKLTEKVELKW